MAGFFETAFGMPLGELVEDVCGGTASGRPVKAGAGGRAAPAPISGPRNSDTTLGYEEFDGAGGLIGHAGVVVFDDTADMLGLARFAMEFCAIESCGKCTPCRIGAVRGVETLDRIRAGDGAATELLVDLLRHDEGRIALRAGGLHALSGDERAAAVPRGIRLCAGGGGVSGQPVSTPSAPTRARGLCPLALPQRFSARMKKQGSAR